MIDAFEVMLGIPLLMVVIGVISGIIFGAIPGLSGGMLIALTLPLTFGWSPINAISLMVGQYVGSISGGLLSATLLNIPGTAASMMTTLDATPMAKSGQVTKALHIGIFSSFIGGMISWLALVFLSPILCPCCLPD